MSDHKLVGIPGPASFGPIILLSTFGTGISSYYAPAIVCVEYAAPALIKVIQINIRFSTQLPECYNNIHVSSLTSGHMWPSKV